MAVASVLLPSATGRFRPRIPLTWASMSPPICYQRISSANTALAWMLGSLAVGELWMSSTLDENTSSVELGAQLSWDWRKILEVLILGQFVVEKVIGAAQASTDLSGSIGLGISFGYVNHVAHLSGALVGAVLVYLVSRIPSQSSHKD